MPKQHLIFVYNANSGFGNMLLDMAHKIVSPKTYPCKLCDITYGIFSVREDWDKFVKGSEAEMSFLHKDEFDVAYPQHAHFRLPAIFMEINNRLELIISDEEMADFKDCTDLINRLHLFNI